MYMTHWSVMVGSIATLVTSSATAQSVPTTPPTPPPSQHSGANPHSSPQPAAYPVASPQPVATPQQPAAYPQQPAAYPQQPAASPQQPVNFTQATPDRTAPAKPPYQRPVLGIGYKIGNGIGFLGADIIIAPIDLIALDFHAAYATWGDADGFGLAPALQLKFRDAPKPTPYVAFGVQYAKMSLGSVSGEATGFFANAGYEWRWDSGLGILLGAGLQHMSSVSASNGTDTISRKGGTLPNLEFGVRYLFL